MPVNHRRHLTYANVISTMALFLVLAGGTTLAATGGNFILGKSNTAGAPTQLSSGTTGSALKVTNSNGGNGVSASGGSVAKNAAALNGTSSAGNGVQGISGKSSASGVYGQNNSTGFGVAGRSPNGTGIMGDSSGGWAVQAFGNASQARAGNGFAKAMAYVDPRDHPSDPIQRCFNSQLPPSQATSGNCGITIRGGSPGIRILDFGFRVDDRFPLISAFYGQVIASARPFPTESPNELFVSTYDHSAGQLANSPFYIVVY